MSDEQREHRAPSAQEPRDREPRDREGRDAGGSGAPAVRTVDLNSDLGEGFGAWSLGDDDALLSVVTSANVACGFHAGDPTVMRRVCAAAARRGVTVGAQVGYRDLPGFGRRFIDVDPAELVNDVLYQIAALDGFARLAGTRVGYVKPHGALYNAIVHHEAQAAAVVEAVHGHDPALPVLGLPGSAWLRRAAEAGLPCYQEAFADRAYTPEGTLVPRREPGAVLHDPEAILARSLRLVTEGVIEAVDGTDLPVRADSLCVHGDTPGAVEIARRLRAALTRTGHGPRPFTTP
ncbi:5-oxoprolinase subunit PxpA [Streptomyces sp. NPDC093085]|uniref:LamB/YcsF family protein n=1 Tax=Streptomyces sp. NPDC093085 TaxID=3155068 RepID=UPI003414FB8D